MSHTFRFFLSFLLSATILILISACGGGSDIPEYCHDPETFVGPQSEECY